VKIDTDKELKNKINSQTGLFVCGGFGNKGCGKDVDLGVLIKGTVFCRRCFEIIKGIRNENGIKRQ